MKHIKHWQPVGKAKISRIYRYKNKVDMMKVMPTFLLKNSFIQVMIDIYYKRFHHQLWYRSYL